MKNFNTQHWNETLAMQDWEVIGNTEDVHVMATLFSGMVNSALDVCAPKKKFTIKPNYKQGLTEGAKLVMANRNKAREELRKNPMEKKALLKKYRKLRNEATNKIRKDVKEVSGARIAEANSESEIWKIVNDITKPREDQRWSIKNVAKF